MLNKKKLTDTGSLFDLGSQMLITAFPEVANNDPSDFQENE